MNFFHSNLIEWIYLDVKCSIKWESNIYAPEREASRKKFRLEDYRMTHAAGSIISYRHSSRFRLFGICQKRDMGKLVTGGASRGCEPINTLYTTNISATNQNKNHLH